MTVVGFVLTVAGIYFYFDMDKFQNASFSTAGIVVDMNRKSDGKSGPVIQFVDVNGNSQVFVSRSSSNPPRYKVNESVDVIYALPRSGTDLEAYVNEKWNILVRKFGVLAFGLLFLVLGIVFGRIFWNRDSMYIGVAHSKDIDLTTSTNKRCE